MLLVVCQLSRDVICCEDSKCGWYVSIRLVSQFSSFRFTFVKLNRAKHNSKRKLIEAWSFCMGYSKAGVALEGILFRDFKYLICQQMTKNKCDPTLRSGWY